MSSPIFLNGSAGSFDSDFEAKHAFLVDSSDTVSAKRVPILDFPRVKNTWCIYGMQCLDLGLENCLSVAHANDGIVDCRRQPSD
jgi:hypothetical protein